MHYSYIANSVDIAIDEHLMKESSNYVNAETVYGFDYDGSLSENLSNGSTRNCFLCWDYDPGQTKTDADGVWWYTPKIFTSKCQLSNIVWILSFNPILPVNIQGKSYNSDGYPNYSYIDKAGIFHITGTRVIPTYRYNNGETLFEIDIWFLKLLYKKAKYTVFKQNVSTFLEQPDVYEFLMSLSPGRDTSGGDVFALGVN